MTEELRPENDESTEITAAECLQHNLATACLLAMMTELKRANKKYKAFFTSSKEALGVIREEYLEVEERLRKVKDFKAEEAKGELALLDKELTQLGAMCAKAKMSLCDMRGEIAAIQGYLETESKEAKEEDSENCE
jgi:hypothetical protein